MQLMLDIGDSRDRLGNIHRRLHRRFDQQGPYLLPDPVSQLVLAMIGGKTPANVSNTAFERLADRFRQWEALLEASAIEIETLIADVTFAEIKAPRLKSALAQVLDTNKQLTLANLSEMSVENALLWLEQLPGVGRKTSAVVLNFSTLQRRALVIDTHHLRVLRRLRLIGWRCDTRHAYDQIMPLLPAAWSADDFSEHHQLIKLLGQTVCRHAAAMCSICPLVSLCPTGRSSQRRLTPENRSPIDRGREGRRHQETSGSFNALLL